jgi:hypothetical protein
MFQNTFSSCLFSDYEFKFRTVIDVKLLKAKVT